MNMNRNNKIAGSDEEINSYYQKVLTGMGMTIGIGDALIKEQLLSAKNDLSDNSFKSLLDWAIVELKAFANKIRNWFQNLFETKEKIVFVWKTN